MESLSKKSFDAADEVRTPDKTKVEVVNLGTTVAGRMTAQPGWKWSECIKPVAGTDSCQTHHHGVAVAGTIHVAHDDGTELDISAGDAYTIEPGHDAWVTSSEAFVGYEFDPAAAANFAKPR